jgi:Icc protein
MPDHPSASRRDLLKSIGFVAGAAAFAGLLPRSAAARLLQPVSSTRKRVLRFAHLTDIHVQPELRAGDGMSACFKHVQSQADKPELILTGGDHVMDSMAADAARTRLQWNLFKKKVKDECSLAIESCIGNHDVFGWTKSSSKATGDEPTYGKNMAMEMLGFAKPYRTFDRAGWRFIVLDSIFPHKESYIGRLDDTQFDWLADTLKSADPKTPVLIHSHIPILSTSAMLITVREDKTSDTGAAADTGDRTLPGAKARSDARRIVKLLAKYPNVKLAVSGHVHTNERVDFQGVTHICDGAVCGNWWKGRDGVPGKDKPYQSDEGYGLFNLFDDGTFEHQYVKYGWKAV